jgi:hypothetical protein
MGCQHLEDEYELYLLGALTDETPGDLRLHLEAQCPTCLQGLREAAESIVWLVQSADVVRPRPAVKSRLMARLNASASGVRTAKEQGRSGDHSGGARKR